MSIQSKSLLRLLAGLIFIAGLLFVAAGSWRFWQGWGWLAVGFIPNFFFFLHLAKRDPQLLEILGEEKFLRRELPGYTEYCLRTRSRLVPFIWWASVAQTCSEGAWLARVRVQFDVAAVLRRHVAR